MEAMCCFNYRDLHSYIIILEGEADLRNEVKLIPPVGLGYPGHHCLFNIVCVGKDIIFSGASESPLEM